MPRPTSPDPDRIALGIRQPWAELILQGKKTIEVRSTSTRVRGQIYIYASKKVSSHPRALEAAQRHAISTRELPLGQLVGMVDVVDARPCSVSDAEAACLAPSDVDGKYGWILQSPVRLSEPLAVRYLPYGVWFYPFRRRNEAGPPSRPGRR